MKEFGKRRSDDPSSVVYFALTPSLADSSKVVIFKGVNTINGPLTIGIVFYFILFFSFGLSV